MENKFRNEMEIEVAGEKILLRPTFENMALMETQMGSIGWMVYKYGKNVDSSSTEAQLMQSLPPLTEAARIIHIMQAEKKFTIEQIYELCLAEGIKIGAQIMLFLVRCTAGNKMQKEPSEKVKKNSKKQNLVESQ